MHYKSEFQGIDVGQRTNGQGDNIGCIILAFRNYDGIPFTVEISRGALERVLEDGEFVLENSDYLNDEATIDEANERIDVSTLPYFDGVDIRVVDDTESCA